MIQEKANPSSAVVIERRTSTGVDQGGALPSEKNRGISSAAGEAVPTKAAVGTASAEASAISLINHKPLNSNLYEVEQALANKTVNLQEAMEPQAAINGKTLPVGIMELTYEKVVLNGMRLLLAPVKYPILSLSLEELAHKY